MYPHLFFVQEGLHKSLCFLRWQGIELIENVMRVRGGGMVALQDRSVGFQAERARALHFPRQGRDRRRIKHTPHR